MDRAERAGFGVAVVGHVALFALLSLSLFSARVPKPPVADTMDVQLVKDVGPTSAAPKVSQEAPAPSEAPEQGLPDDTTPPPPAPAPEPKAQPKPTPPKPTPPKPEPKPEAKPAPVKPEPKPKPEKPRPEKPAPEKPAPEKPAKGAPEKPSKAAPAKPSKATGLSSDFLKDLPQDKPGPAKPKGSRLGSDFLKGLSPDKSPGKASAPHASAISAQSLAGIGSLIKSQVKPNYNPPTGGADAASIVTTLHITMARDGQVSGVEVVGHQGINASNSAYVKQADEAAIRAVKRSSPLHLPPAMYDGGWQDITLNFRPDQME